ncbi:DUF2281 domain-containing protein [Iningainema tapete]|uniref:DUF2281 domain-containing protein n=1 Tax=Iningainema tapete BLCC-T55 TaxID=2748662 RepID=A0A8J6XPJ9_9CYAN|nr:DUF2281 domain-containing protein [Iningainema tapete]MBD2777102.1 DUF2281 domain-containing protein [Iningainema tapete BLCC-T55]
MTSIKPIQEVWKDLPLDLQQQVGEFAEFLLHKHRASTKPLQLKWAGALRDYKNLSAQDLQREVLESWGVTPITALRT